VVVPLYTKQVHAGVRRGNLGLLTKVKTPLVEKQAGVAVRNYNPDLIGRINKGMADLFGQEYDGIRQKWLSPGGRGLDPVYVRNMVLKFFLGGGVLLLLIFLWHRQVREFMKNNIPNINELHTDSPESCMQEWVVLL
jgi:hypothetical protein